MVHGQPATPLADASPPPRRALDPVPLACHVQLYNVHATQYSSRVKTSNKQGNREKYKTETCKNYTAFHNAPSSQIFVTFTISTHSKFTAFTKAAIQNSITASLPPATHTTQFLLAINTHLLVLRHVCLRSYLHNKSSFAVCLSISMHTALVV